MSDVQAIGLASTATLIEAVARGSRPALKRLYELESRRLYGIALRIVRRPEVAADVLQEAFIQIWQNAQSYSAERGAGGAWLTGIVRFRALDAVRKHGREVLSDDLIMMFRRLSEGEWGPRMDGIFRYTLGPYLE